LEGEEDLETLSKAFDQIGYYFGEMGFSLDELLADAPEEVRDAFGFGTFDMSDEEILQKYDPNCKGMSLEQIKAGMEDGTIDTSNLSTLKGNAYVMRFAEDAAGRTAEDVMGDVTNLIGALSTSVSPQDVINYYNKLNPDAQTNDYNVASAALTVGGMIPAEMVVAVANSDVKNTSGISALGSLYALGAGYFNSTYYEGEQDSIPNFANFQDIFIGEDGVMSDANKAGFMEYLGTFNEKGELVTAGQAQKDIDAYLNYMEYVAANGVTMDSNQAFFGQSGDIWDLISGSAGN